MEGFFSVSEVTAKKPNQSILPQCGVCKLYTGCTSPKMEPAGEGRRRILVVGESPTEPDDATGLHFHGERGDFLKQRLQWLRVNLLRDCWVTNALICKNDGADDDKRVDYCRPNLLATIKRLQPEVIIPLGRLAVRSVLGHVWKDDIGDLERWVGWQIPSQKLNAWICPTWSAYDLIRRDSQIRSAMYEKHLKAATSLEGRPWAVVPDYKAQVELMHDPERAAKFIRKVERVGGRIAFDYESNTLKPDPEHASLRACSICWEGERTVAFPWLGAVVPAMRELLASKSTAKFGANIKHEHKWTAKKLGVWVRNWKWDVMVAAHVIDNRDGIVSLKFQGFVLDGVSPWNTNLDKLLKSEDGTGNGVNRIKDISLDDLLLYNGLDSLVNYKVAIRQMNILGVPT